MTFLRIDGIYADGTLYREGFLLALSDFEANYRDQRDVRVLITAPTTCRPTPLTKPSVP